MVSLLHCTFKKYGRLMRRALLFIVIAAGLWACNGSRALTKKGGQLQQAGMYSDAAMFYYNALLKNQANVDARIGLTQTAQKVLNDKLSDFSKAHALGEVKTAVYAYRDAARYREKVEKLGIKLSAPGYFEKDYEEVKSRYVRQLYDRGNALMGEKNFAEAQAVFSELLQLDPEYKDAGNLQSISQNEPVYIEATALFDSKQWRKAYYTFDQIYRNNPGYKDVAILRNECLENGQYPIALMPFNNETRYRDIEKQFRAFTLTALSRVDDPFLKIVERDNMDEILREQRLNLSGVINQQSAAAAGNLLGAKAILYGSVLGFTTHPGKMRVEEKKAFEGYRVKLKNEAEGVYYYETRYKPVTYHEYYNLNEVKVSFQYKLVSLETGAILKSEIINKTLDSDVYYGTYDGEITALYPADGTNVLTSNRARNQLVSLMRASRDLKSIDELSSEAFRAVAGVITTDLLNEIRTQ